MIRDAHFVDDPDRQCGRKRRYLSKTEAKLAMKRNQTIAGNARQRNVVYRCPHCDFFHYGKHPGSRRKENPYEGETNT